MPRPRKNQKASNIPLHADILEMSLVGFEAAKMKIETQILAIKKALGAASRSYAMSTATEPEAPTKKRRKSNMSAEGRARISAATKARWAAKRKADAAALKPKGKKKGPKLSAAERAKLSAGQAGTA